MGVDKIADLVDTAELVGAIQKGGAWYTVGEERLQGRAKVIEWLKEDPKRVADLEAKLNV
jgi:recombination protein RecA